MAARLPLCVRAPSAAWDAAVERYLSALPVAVLPRPDCRSWDDMPARFSFEKNVNGF